ncbi:cytochrome P450 [Curtobacterium sp. YC1]|uniref:cytochrome P450 n=1 Tax=Curtobacterium sp. YC1 TaxID=2795488 RepID=UPI0018E5A7E6|nr:cytochrome P450 [Curtobacterium sp. YC1]QQD75023.1 cytochrome P450 [Curtobacterium sp. YC1]
MALDDSLSLLTRGYGFGAHLWRRTRPGARAVRFRLLGKPALFVRGAEGVELFYDGARTARHGAMPAIVQRTLFGVGSVHSLDGPDHHHRKATFVDVSYEDEQVRRLAPLLTQEWAAERAAWVTGGTRSAYDAAVGAIGRAVMRWAGLPGTPAAKTRWAARLAQVVDGFGVPYSPEYLQAVLNRHWSDRHAKRLIEAVRGGRLTPAPDTALHEWAWHRDLDGALLSPRLAGIELQNSIRPAIAVARFVAFAAKELHDRPEWRSRIAAETAAVAGAPGNAPSEDGQSVDGPPVDGPLAVAFAQEIRRTAPFVPMLPAWATTDVELDGEHLRAGGRVVLDITGTDTDDRSWDRAADFDPTRFLGVDDFEAITTFVPHGGADVATGHRCPGEKVAIAALAAGVAVLSDPRVTILDDGLEVDRRRLPTKPASGGTVRGGCPFH